MHRRDPLKGQSPSAEKAQQGSLPPETRHRECLLPGEGFGPHHPTPRQDQHLLPRLHPPRLRYPQHPTRQLPGQGRLTLSVDPSLCQLNNLAVSLVGGNGWSEAAVDLVEHWLVETLKASSSAGSVFAPGSWGHQKWAGGSSCSVRLWA